MKMDASHYSYKGFVGNTQKPRHAQIIRADDMFFKEVNETNDTIEKEMVPQVLRTRTLATANEIMVS